MDPALANTTFTLGIVLVLAGFAISFLAGILMALRQPGGGRVKGGGVVMIGPFPIVFGSDAKTAKMLIVLAILLMVVMLAMALLPALLG